ncbi:MAG: tRNA (adenosine(37)-N6)-threonylcarbamoyltransferase complex transferase subunit TsaD [Planctomycetes bacterium]|nr:tRNA (adenosine(37)-N6)-threonylcarbamoyltransferase complex transferase subunit TsaD [Planctomycetota bacterium]MCP4839824.1 tRNA (adenosine(37)-N6)-threonylcarbamoyltransferase complex transferase subunit TsaD [Planctomycetota bacterium]
MTRPDDLRDVTMPLILGIETSCDESAAAVVEGPDAVRSSIVATQHDLHERFAGVVPEIASRAHAARTLPVIDEAIREAGIELKDLDAVAVGHTPGLIGSLLVGVSTAKSLAWSLDIPIIGVHHLLAHLHAPALDDDPIEFPALSLIASGGHTALYRQMDSLSATRVGSTIDDAVGEAFDKAATMLDAGYPGGPAIERLAVSGDPNAIDLPIPKAGQNRCDFSYAGLKTALLYAVRGHPVGRGRAARFPRAVSELTHEARADLAASFQRCAIAALMRGVAAAATEGQFRSLCAGGGVLANSELRRQLGTFAESHGLKLRVPPLRYCVDNAAMIAGLAAIRLQAGLVDDLELQASPRQPIAPPVG